MQEKNETGDIIILGLLSWKWKFTTVEFMTDNTDFVVYKWRDYELHLRRQVAAAVL